MGTAIKRRLNTTTNLPIKPIDECSWRHHISSKATKKWCWRGSPAGFGTSFGSLRHQVCTNFAGLPILSAISAFSRPSCQGLVIDLMRLDGITQDALIHCDSPGRAPSEELLSVACLGIPARFKNVQLQENIWRWSNTYLRHIFNLESRSLVGWGAVRLQISSRISGFAKLREVFFATEAFQPEFSSERLVLNKIQFVTE